MPDLRLPISKKQHAMLAETYRQMNALSQSITTAASTIMAGADQDIPTANVRGVDDANGVFELVLDVPEPAKQ